MLLKLNYYFYALVTLRPAQLFWFLRRRVFTFSFPLPDISGVSPRSVPSSKPMLAFDMESNHQAWQFRYLNKTHQFTQQKMDWQPQEMSRLWQYNLHYFDFLRQADMTSECKESLIDDWIDCNPVGTVTAWEPYTASLRIVNWVKFYHQIDQVAINPKVLDSLALQIEWLYRNVELHILANHLFKNIKALIFGGVFLEGKAAEAWLVYAEKILIEQIYEQSLEDGGHYERSPMYHAIYLEDLLDIINYAEEFLHKETVFLLKEKALAGTLFCRDLCLTDGEMPLFNDSAMGIAPDIKTLIQYAEKVLEENFSDKKNFPSQTSFPSTGYYCLGTDKMKMIIDCGETGPRYQPGHTHCDTLSYELSVGEQRVVVDTGTHDYEGGNKRRYDRSTAAHNTIVIDGQEQSQIWGVFRVARRAAPIDAKLQILDKPTIASRFVGSHNGYHRLKRQVTHQREVIFDEGKGWVVVDSVEGQGKHSVENYIHLHPSLIIESKNKSINLFTDKGVKLCEILLDSVYNYRIDDSVYHPKFGVEFANKAICIYTDSTLPIKMSYTIQLCI